MLNINIQTNKTQPFGIIKRIIIKSMNMNIFQKLYGLFRSAFSNKKKQILKKDDDYEAWLGI